MLELGLWSETQSMSSPETNLLLGNKLILKEEKEEKKNTVIHVQRLTVKLESG